MSKNETKLTWQVWCQIFIVPSYAIWQVFVIIESFNNDSLLPLPFTILKYISIIIFFCGLICYAVLFQKNRLRKKIIDDEYTQLISYKTYRCSVFIMIAYQIIIGLLINTVGPLILIRIMCPVLVLSILVPNLIYALKD